MKQKKMKCLLCFLIGVMLCKVSVLSYGYAVKKGDSFTERELKIVNAYLDGRTQSDFTTLSKMCINKIYLPNDGKKITEKMYFRAFDVVLSHDKKRNIVLDGVYVQFTEDSGLFVQEGPITIRLDQYKGQTVFVDAILPYYRYETSTVIDPLDLPKEKLSIIEQGLRKKFSPSVVDRAMAFNVKMGQKSYKSFAVKATNQAKGTFVDPWSLYRNIKKMCSYDFLVSYSGVGQSKNYHKGYALNADFKVLKKVVGEEAEKVRDVLQTEYYDEETEPMLLKVRLNVTKFKHTPNVRNDYLSKSEVIAYLLDLNQNLECYDPMFEASMCMEMSYSDAPIKDSAVEKAYPLLGDVFGDRVPKNGENFGGEGWILIMVPKYFDQPRLKFVYGIEDRVYEKGIYLDLGEK